MKSRCVEQFLSFVCVQAPLFERHVPSPVQEVRVVDLSEPSGWIIIPLGSINSKASDMPSDQLQHDTAQPLQTFLLQVCNLGSPDLFPQGA
jgi:hypothetical protein